MFTTLTEAIRRIKNHPKPDTIMTLNDNPEGISESLKAAIAEALEQMDSSETEANDEAFSRAARHVLQHKPDAFDPFNPQDDLILSLLNLS